MSIDARIERDRSYITRAHARRALGYLTTSLPELENVVIPELMEKWDEAIDKTRIDRKPEEDKCRDKAD